MAKTSSSNFVWPDARGWVGIGIYLLTCVMLAMMWADPDLRKDDFFQNIMILIVGTGFINGVVSWAYSATQGGAELANRNASVVETVAAATVEKNGHPKEVKVVNPPSEPIPADVSPSEELPDYARDS